MNLKALPRHRLFTRISMDLDDKDRWELYRVTDFIFHNLGQYPEVYETTKGYHVWLDLRKDHDLTIQKIMEMTHSEFLLICVGLEKAGKVMHYFVSGVESGTG